ncbi:hypothetical protein [Streptomyces sp. WAC06614]|uniref:hypothetical protein n=1 Tax=Streptomyces sp. WAC06614 TaxID=2487416 RepID=UPI0021AFF2EF|nr:hypothetical protein [Streptomyces sp. WAC06614]
MDADALRTPAEALAELPCDPAFRTLLDRIDDRVVRPLLKAAAHRYPVRALRLLAPVIRSWPGEGAHQRAVDGLDVLGAIGTDTALLSLHGIAQRARFKALKARAGERIAEVAAGLGLTAEQLADRLVPDLGLDAHGTTTVDYGGRRFTVGFDEQLTPYVADATGRRLRDCPSRVRRTTRSSPRPSAGGSPP